jgi:hypothetical protein
MKASNSRSFWSRILIVLGSIGMIAGAIDPMEGSVIILPEACWWRSAPFWAGVTTG